MPTGEIVHIGDTAGVPQQLVAGLRDLGYPARAVVPPVPLAGAPRVLKALSIPVRLAQSRRVAADARRDGASLLHVHYATAALGYLGSGLPLVVHAHGSDVRVPGLVDRRLLAIVWARSAIRLVSTPDLLDRVPDAIYLPNPVELASFAAAGTSPPDRDVFVFAALTEVKGADRLVRAVDALRSATPGLSITALEGGPYTEAMARAGATVVPRLRPDEIPAFVARHRVVLGQQRLGVLGVSELQAMATGRPVVTHIDPTAVYGTARPPIIEAHAPDEIAEAVGRLLADPPLGASLGAAGAAWVRDHHGREAVTRRLIEIYATLVALPPAGNGQQDRST